MTEENQLSVAELLARNGQQSGSAPSGGGRRRRSGRGISVADLTGDIPVVKAGSSSHAAADEEPPESVPAPASPETDYSNFSNYSDYSNFSDHSGYSAPGSTAQSDYSGYSAPAVEPSYSPLSGPISYYDPLAGSGQPEAPSLPEPSGYDRSGGVDWPPAENPPGGRRSAPFDGASGANGQSGSTPRSGRRRKPDPLDSDVSLSDLDGLGGPAPEQPRKEGGRRRRFDPDDDTTDVRPFRGDSGPALDAPQFGGTPFGGPGLPENGNHPYGAPNAPDGNTSRPYGAPDLNAPSAFGGNVPGAYGAPDAPGGNGPYGPNGPAGNTLGPYGAPNSPGGNGAGAYGGLNGTDNASRAFGGPNGADNASRGFGGPNGADSASRGFGGPNGADSASRGFGGPNGADNASRAFGDPNAGGPGAFGGPSDGNGARPFGGPVGNGPGGFGADGNGPRPFGGLGAPDDSASRTQYLDPSAAWAPGAGPDAPVRGSRPGFEPTQAAPAAPPLSRSARRHAEARQAEAQPRQDEWRDGQPGFGDARRDDRFGPGGPDLDRDGGPGVQHGAPGGLPAWSARRRQAPDAAPGGDRREQAAVPTAAWTLAEDDQQLVSGETVAGDLLRDARERGDERADHDSRRGGKRRAGGFGRRGAAVAEPEPDDHLTDFYEPLDADDEHDDYDDDYDDEPRPSLTGRLSSVATRAKKAAKPKPKQRTGARNVPARGAKRGPAKRAGTEADHRRQWMVLAGQSVGAAVAGMLLFKGFESMWEVLPWVALALAMIVILGLVALVRVLRRTDDIFSTVIAVVVGVFVTLGPLAFLLSTN